MTIFDTEILSQPGSKIDDNVVEYIDSMESNISFQINTIVKYVVYGTHGEPIQHSFPIQLSFNKAKKLVSATDLRLRVDGKLVYWFAEGKIVAKPIYKRISEDTFDISVSKQMNSIDNALIVAIFSMSNSWQM